MKAAEHQDSQAGQSGPSDSPGALMKVPERRKRYSEEKSIQISATGKGGACRESPAGRTRLNRVSFPKKKRVEKASGWGKSG